jgi:colanic acid biosynthesis protein WcaH
MKDANISDAIRMLKEKVPDPSQGLPDELFYYISATTPMVNVDLLIKDEKGRTLLSWRDDRYAGHGWHIPGGIVRFKETLEGRIQQVAKTEVGVDRIEFEKTPLAIHQIIHPHRDTRGHFISILYRCFLPGTFLPKNAGLAVSDSGYLMWHSSGPDNLLALHEIYRSYL